MSVWEYYPSTYRSAEVSAVLSAARAGECTSIIGLSGAGKSNLMGFLTHRVKAGPTLELVDCNLLPAPTLPDLLAAMAAELGESLSGPAGVPAIFPAVEKRLRANPAGLCFLLDRFDPFNTPSHENRLIASNLRALRDRFKYSLTYVTATREPLDPASEWVELFSGHTLWLAPLLREDALWSIRQYAARHQTAWDDGTIEEIFRISGGYPSLLRAVSEAAASGVPLDPAAMRSAPAVLRRTAELLAGAPSPEALRLSGLADHPLLQDAYPAAEVPDLTALEQRLLDHFTANPGRVCTKDELIQAVWPDEKIAAGLRDDSLAQLIHRLREKIGLEGGKRIQTVPGRGYRYRALL